MGCCVEGIAVSLKVTVGQQRTASTQGSWKEGEPQKEEGTGGVIREAPSVLFKPTYSSTLVFLFHSTE